MDMSPQRVRSAEFKTVRKGADLDEVRRFLNDVADELERAQNQSTAMEARARAAVARLQEVSEGQTAAPRRHRGPRSRWRSRPTSPTRSAARSCWRNAPLTHSSPKPVPKRPKVVATANDEAAATRDSTREMAAAMLDEARDEARRTGESERLLAASEVDALKARRDFLESDVDHLEQFLVAQRARVRDAATELIEITDRVPAGLGDVRRPLLSASDDDPADQQSIGTSTGTSVDASPSGESNPSTFPSAAVADDLDATQAIDLVIVTEIDDVEDHERRRRRGR